MLKQNEPGPIESRALLIKGPRIIDPARGMDQVGDILIGGGKILATGAISADDIPQDCVTLEAAGLVASPGFIDLHCHLREPGFGSALAAASIVPSRLSTSASRVSGLGRGAPGGGIIPARSFTIIFSAFSGHSAARSTARRTDSAVVIE